MRSPIVKYVLLLSLIAQLWTPSAVVAATKEESKSSKQQETSKQNLKAVLTISWLSQTYQVSEAALLQELNKGYTLHELHQALQLERESGQTLAQKLNQINPAVEQRLQQLDYSAERLLANNGPYADTLAYVASSVTEAASSSTDEMTTITESTYGHLLTSMRMGASAYNIPTSYDELAIKRMNTSIDNAPYALSSGSENVSTVNGSLQLQATDLSLPGRNGLSFSLNRMYDSSSAFYYEKRAELTSYVIASYYPEFLASIEQRQSNNTYSFYQDTTFDRQLFFQYGSQYIQWNSPFPITTMDYGQWEEKTRYESTTFKARNKATDAPYYTYGFSLSNIPFQAKLYPTGRLNNDPSSPPSFQGVGYYNRTVNDNMETKFPIGKGWRWDIPFIESKDGKRYVHLFGGGSYELGSDLSLKGYPWKDITLSHDPATVQVNGVSSAYVLTSIQGNKQYFSTDGKLLQISDAYNNTVQFEYSTVSPYGEVLSKVRDALGNEINITYSATEVVLTLGDRTVKYAKIKDPQGNKELLSAVTDAGGRTTQYAYEIASAPFDLVGASSMKDNYVALLKQVYYPTQARAAYTYQSFTRNLGSFAKEQVYRVSSRENVIDYQDGSKEQSGHLDFSYSGDGGSNQKSDFNFSTTVDDGLKKTTYTYKKDYIDDDTPDVYYNTSMTQQAGTEKQVTTQTFNEARRLPVPDMISTTYTNGSATSSPVTVKKTYDDYGNVMTETNPLNVTTTYTYDASHWLKSIVQPVDTSKSTYTEFERYPQGAVKQMTVRTTNSDGPLKAQMNYQYDAYGNMSLMTIKNDQRDLIVSQTYAYPIGDFMTVAQSVNVTNADGVSSTIMQSAQYKKGTGTLSRLTDAKGNTTTYEYDKLGRITKERLPDLTESNITYDDIGNTLTITDAMGMQIVREFNALGQRVKETVGSAYTTYGYDPYGRLKWSKDMLGQLTEQNYDAWGRIVKVTYPDLAEDSIVYNDVSRTQTTKDAEQNETRQTYDIIGRPVTSEKVKDGVATLLSSTSYDYAGNVVRATDAKGSTTSYEYDELSRLLSVTDPLSNVTRYSYNLAGNLTGIQYADGTQMEKKYDELGRLITRINTSTQLADKYYYDANGNITKHVDRKGQAITYTYHSLRDFLLQSVSPNETVTYSYDAAGRRLSMQDGTGTTTYAYTPETGKLSKVTYPDNKTIQYAYDSMGRRSDLTTPFDYHIAYGYDQRNRLEWVGESANNRDVTYTYKKNGLPSTIEQKNGVVTSLTLDRFQIKDMVQTKHEGAALNSFSYLYDANNNQTSKTENGISQSFTYDKLNRIETSTLFSEQYTYDARGNRQTLQSSSPPQISSAEYEYDDHNRLVKVTTEGNTVTYKYNGDGLLYERSENGTTTRYYYDGADVIAEGTVTGGVAVLKANYIRGNGLVARSDSTGSKAYYLHNAHGDVTELTNSNGSTLNQYTYDMWGNILSQTESVPQPFKYSGELWDNTTSLQYLRARWYDPSIGRFINEDTYEGQIDNPLSLNLYTYVENNPLTRVDPSGHAFSRVEVETYLDIARQVGAYGNTGPDWWRIRSIMGVESLKSMENAVDHNNQFKFLFNMATLNHYVAEENTIENADWARNELINRFGFMEKMEQISNNMAMGIMGPGSGISRISSRIKNSSGLVKAAEEMGETKLIQKEADDLVQKFIQGNKNPGIGSKDLIKGISYLRGKEGARVFYRVVDGEMQILAKSNKANEQTVINILKKIYGD